jgi:hypothetical protein
VYDTELVTARWLIRAIFALAASTVAGCGSEDDRPPVWGYISPAIIQPNCATSSCHSSGAAVAGMDLASAKNGLISLKELKLPPPRGMILRPLVTPYQPDASRLVNMLRATGANRMPPERPLAEADIVLIEKWILNGAQDD